MWTGFYFGSPNAFLRNRTSNLVTQTNQVIILWTHFYVCRFSITIKQDLLTYLLTYSMVQIPSWQANWFPASQEIPRISRNPKVHYRTHKCPPPVSILGQPNPVHIPTSRRSILILSTHPCLGLPSGLLPSGFPKKTLYTPLLLTRMHHMPSPSHSSRFYHLHHIGWGVRIIWLLVMRRVLHYYNNQLYPVILHTYSWVCYQAVPSFLPDVHIIQVTDRCLKYMSNLTIFQQDETVFILLHFGKQLYMFRVLTPIIRSWYSCNYSFWYWLSAMSKIHCYWY